MKAACLSGELGLGPEAASLPGELDPAAVSNPPPARAIYGQRMLLCLVIVVHKWQNWTRFQSSAEGKPPPAGRAAATKNAFHALGREEDLVKTNRGSREDGDVMEHQNFLIPKHVKPACLFHKCFCSDPPPQKKKNHKPCFNT